MTRLQDLPEDILAQILVGEISVEAVALWMTLNRQMQAKLNNGGILHLELDPFIIGGDVSWPIYLRNFRLRSLKFSSLSTPVTPPGPYIRSELRQLWPGLESLEVRGMDVEKAFKLAKPPTKKKRAAKFSRKGNKRAKLAEDVEPTPEEVLYGDWNMNLTHPSLKTLIIASTHTFNNRTHPPIDFVNIAFLPRSLTHLDVSHTRWTLTQEDCINLPPQLITLIVPSKPAPRRNWRYTPIDDGGDLEPVINEFVIDCLPHSITRIDSPTGTGACYTTAALLTLATPERTCLPHLYEFPDTGTTQLWEEVHQLNGGKWPSNLFKMVLKPSLRNDSWSSDIFAFHHLPTTITSLTTESIKWSDHPQPNPNETIWPPTLTSLTLTDPYCCNYFHLLPRNLKRFTLHTRRDSDNSRVRDLSTLATSGQTTLNNIDTEKWTNIKRQLISIRDTELNADSRSDLDFYISEVESGALFGLPLTLEYVTCMSRNGDCPLSIVPPLVHRADLSSLHELESSLSPLRAISPYLREFTWSAYHSITLTGRNGLRNSRISKLTIITGATKTVSSFLMDNLPPNLKHLRIKPKYSNAPIAFEQLKNLPQSLITLQLYADLPTNNPVPWTSLLPHGLKELNINQSLGASDYKSLPPSLTVLSSKFPTGNLAELEPRPASLLKGAHYEYGYSHIMKFVPWPRLYQQIKKTEEQHAKWESDRLAREAANKAAIAAAPAN